MEPRNQDADELFKAGMFAEAEQRYAEALRVDSGNIQALARLGTIALLTNRLADAQKWLTRAIELKSGESWSRRAFGSLARRWFGPEQQTPEALLGQVFCLRDDYRQAAPLLRAAGWKALADKLESFGAVRPYDIENKAEVVRIKFIRTDPLPVVQVRVNHSAPVNFFIDTGGAEVILDTDFAQEIGVMRFGIERGVFGGGKTAGFQHGRVDSLMLGDVAVENVPVIVMNVRPFSGPVFDGLRVDGIIGTFFLYHFLATLDYPAGELILRQKTEQNRQRLEQEAQADSQAVVPFWMADHYMVAWGTVDGSEPLLFFVDTGLAGNGFTCPESTLKAAGIKLKKEIAGEGIGGGGKMMSIPFDVEELTLGDAREHNIPGVYGPFPPHLENAFGFHIGGLISHSFFRPYALTLDFTGMRYFLKRKG